MGSIEPPSNRVLLFGGSFDPIHCGHLFIAEEARRIAHAEQVAFVPLRTPRHRGPLDAASTDRVAMVRLAIASNPAFSVDESELGPEASNYTADLLEQLHATRPGTQFDFLAGEDSLLGAPWHRFDDVLARIGTFYVARRRREPDDTAEFLDDFQARQSLVNRDKFVTLEHPLIDISATELRDRLLHRRTVRYLVPDGVRHYIAEHHLYIGAHP